MRLDVAQKVADAVLYEGYVLYPYRASSDKNRARFQFGVVAPRAQVALDASESWDMQTECLVAPDGDPALDVRVRFLQLQAREVQAVEPGSPEGFVTVPMLAAGDEDLVTWDEASDEQVDLVARPVATLLEAEAEVEITLPGARDVEHVHGPDGSLVGRIVRSRWPIRARVVVGAEPAGDLIRVRVRVENLTDWADADAGRDQTLRRSLLGCHAILGVTGGTFLSLTDPPEGAREAAHACINLRAWPVLVGEPGAADVLLSAPIILPDHPEIAPESPGDLFDATEIDEILTLRVMTLTDEEKRAARATDPRARRIIDRADTIPPEMLDRLHGAIRYLRGSPAAADATADPFAMPASTWEPEAKVAPERAAITVGGQEVAKGSSVVLRPRRRADAMDIFLEGRVATVEAVFESVDDETYVAVTVDDDPATDLHRAYGRFFYFGPDEIEPVASRDGAREAAS